MIATHKFDLALIAQPIDWSLSIIGVLFSFAVIPVLSMSLILANRRQYSNEPSNTLIRYLLEGFEVGQFTQTHGFDQKTSIRSNQSSREALNSFLRRIRFAHSFTDSLTCYLLNH